MILGCTEDVIGIIDAKNSDDKGISKMRLKLVKGDKININDVIKKHFEPVKNTFVNKAHIKISLYAGRLVTGEDIVPGTYNSCSKRKWCCIYI